MNKSNTHIVIKREDVRKYLSESEQQTLEQLLAVIRNGRRTDGKNPSNTYYICNTDETYAEKVHDVIMGAEYDKAYKIDILSDESQQKAVEDNWNELYDLANRFLESLDIHYHVKKKRIVLKDGPVCYVDIPVKGNKDIFATLKKLSCTYECMGHVVDGVKYAEYGLIMNKVRHLLSGGEEITLCPGNSAIINIFEVDKPEITEEYLRNKETQLRDVLDEANKCNMYGTKYATEKLKDTSDLDAEPRWKEIAVKVLEEYAKMDTN